MPGSAGNVTVAIVPEIEGKPEADGQRYGQQFGNAASSALDSATIAIGNILSTVVQNVAAVIGETFADAFNSYADYEQLVGGVETLFKDSSSVVQEYAAQAYATAGMSANQYMEQVTSFSASLLQGLGGDTEAAAKYADMAMRDMSDNANKMGSSMESITNAYQGFAKQNYTMLDNLKLGYGGTKTEMERLLADASKIAGVEFDIDNYSDVIQAIHVMQEEMGIAGTTAEEAQNTISGSLSMLKASWQNFLTGVFDENADMVALSENLFDSLSAVLKNVVPRLGVLVTRAITELPGAIATAIRNIPDTLAPTLRTVFGDEMGQSITESLFSVTSIIYDALNRIIAVIQGVLERVMPLVQPVLDLVTAAVETAMPLIEQAIDTVLSFLENQVLPTVTMVVDGIMPIVQGIVDFVSAALPVIGDVVSMVMSGVESVVSAVMPVVQGIVETALSAIQIAFDALSPIADFVLGIFNGIKAAMEDPINTAKSVIEGAINAIKGFFNFQIQWPHIPLPHFNVSGSINPLDWLSQGPPHFSIDWYAKGGFVDGATLIGAGEKGAEMILPQQGKLLEDFAEAISDKINGGGDTFVFNITADSETTLQSLVAQAQRARIAYGRA